MKTASARADLSEMRVPRAHEPTGDAYQLAPFPKLRRVLALLYPAVMRTHKVHGLIEVDVTDARRLLRERKARTGEALSFTAFLIACVARAVDENKSLNACRAGPGHLAIFQD